MIYSRFRTGGCQEEERSPAVVERLCFPEGRFAHSFHDIKKGDLP
jgi:hypothetical protein